MWPFFLPIVGTRLNDYFSQLTLLTPNRNFLEKEKNKCFYPKFDCSISKYLLSIMELSILQQLHCVRRYPPLGVTNLKFKTRNQVFYILSEYLIHEIVNGQKWNVINDSRIVLFPLKIHKFLK